MTSIAPKPFVLMILDGWGYRPQKEHNAAALAKTPFIDYLLQHYPHRLLDASGISVGLPPGQMGNSEVGHLHLGAGRIIKQSLLKINQQITDNRLQQNQILQQAAATAIKHKSNVHICGLLSPGGVHSHQEHIAAVIKSFQEDHQLPCYLHAFLDGRDVPPQSAQNTLEQFEALYEQYNQGGIASVCGRFFAMDRDKRWDRTEEAFNLIAHGQAPFHAANSLDALQQAYARDETDEFIKPTTISIHDKVISLKPQDVIVFMNFRADRSIQLCQALAKPHFKAFNRGHYQPCQLVTLTPYQDDIPATIIFPPKPIINSLPDILAHHHKKQLRIAETEKYAHVTYFFNGGKHGAYPGEERILIPSPKVLTYDATPAMSAFELTDVLCQNIKKNDFDVIICNYANADMIGHTGNMDAAIECMEVLDSCLRKVIGVLLSLNGAALITADHGNIEFMFNEETGQMHTAHTSFQVPLIYAGLDDLHFDHEPAGLADIAPTILSLLKMEQPSNMTGRPLLHHD